MVKNKMQVGIALGLMCVILVTSIIVQLKTIEEAKTIVGSSYAQSELKEEVLRWKEQYESIYKNLEEKEEELEMARQTSTKENSRLLELREELNQKNRLLGLTEVKGSGIILTVKDNDITSSKEMGANISKALVHEEDLREIVNELKNTGAEAISINGQRIVATTSINCAGAIITINEVKVNSPFEIKAIGNVASLSGITRPGGYLSIMEDEGIIATFEKSNNVTVEKYSGVNNPKYMKNVER